jgi:phage-related protein
MQLKAIEWIGSSKKDLLDLPEDVVDDIGYALYHAQKGLKHEDAKVLKGFGSADVLEIVADDKAGTYRAVYTVRFKEIVFVLHIFQKKSKQGIATPKREIDTLKARLKMAEEMYKKIYKK